MVIPKLQIERYFVAETALMLMLIASLAIYYAIVYTMTTGSMAHKTNTSVNTVNYSSYDQHK